MEDLTALGLSFRIEGAEKAVISVLRSLAQNGETKATQLDFGDFVDGLNESTAYTRRRTIKKQLVGVGLITVNGHSIRLNPEAMGIIQTARKNASIERAKEERRNSFKPVSDRVAAYDDKPHKETRIEFLRNLFTNSTQQLFTADEILSSKFNKLVFSVSSERAKYAALRGTIRKLVEEGLVLPLSTRVFASIEIAEDELVQAKKTNTRELTGYFSDDPKMGILSDLPSDPRMIKRVLDRRFDRSAYIHKKDGRIPNKATLEDSVALFRRDASAHPLLTEDGEKYLFKIFNEVEDYDISEWVRDRIFKSNLRLVINIAKRYPLEDKDLGRADLIAEGCIGLLHAIDLFEPGKGFKLSTFATFWIRQAIGRAIDQKKSLVRLPGDKVATYRSHTKELSKYGLSWSDDPERLKQTLGLNDSDLRETIEIGRLLTTASLNKVVGDDGDAELGDLAAYTEDSYDDIELLDPLVLVESYSGMLTDRQKKMLLTRFSRRDNSSNSIQSYRQVGEAFGVTAEAARRSVQRSMDLIREEAQHAKVDLSDYLFRQ